MKKIKFAAAAAVIPLLCACASGEPKESTRDMFAMDTVISVKAYGEGSDAAVQAAADRITELERLFSVTDENSDISRVNTYGSAQVSPDTEHVVREALAVSESTGGALDITMYPVLREWGFTTDDHRVPEDGEIAAALADTGWRNVVAEPGKLSVPAGFMLDLGSCAKGYAGDEMLKAVSQCGVTSALVNLGGNVQTLGSKPDGSDWSVGIANPFSPNELLGILSVSDKAVVTSGGYQRFFTDDDGNVYIHILDPKTGRPADSGLVSVTVIGDEGLMCDALSTALFVMGREPAVDYWRAHGGFEMILVTDDGTVYATESAARIYSDRSGMPVEIVYEQ